MESERLALQNECAEILKQLAALAPFRRGTVTVNYRRCGKPSCHCTKKGERGHGPRHLWMARIAGKTYSRNLSTPAQVKHYEEETSRHRIFAELCARYAALNERLCDLNVSGQGDTMTQVKKKRQK